MLFIPKQKFNQALLPIFKRVAAYEKEKLGDEWGKQRKSSAISLFILSGVMLINANLSRGSTDTFLHSDILLPVSFIFLILLITVNIFLTLHIRKVDNSDSATDLKGYTKRSNIIGILAGTLIAIFLVITIVFYVLITSFL